MNKKRTALIILLTISFITLTLSSVYVIKYKINLHKEEQIVEELKEKIKNPEPNIIEGNEEIKSEISTAISENEPKEPEVLPEYQGLYEENSDLVGWITIDEPNSNQAVLDYPVMQTEIGDPNYYIDKNFYKEDSIKGSIFLDARVTSESENTIIYGHHMKDGSMFGSLKKYTDKSFYEEHKIIHYNSIYEKSDYEIIGVVLAKVFYEEDAKGQFEFYNYIELDSEEEFNEYINYIEENSLYDTGKSAKYGEDLITLCTCYYHVNDGRLLIIAKKVQ